MATAIKKLDLQQISALKPRALLQHASAICREAKKLMAEGNARVPYAALARLKADGTLAAKDLETFIETRKLLIPLEVAREDFSAANKLALAILKKDASALSDPALDLNNPGLEPHYRKELLEGEAQLIIEEHIGRNKSGSFPTIEEFKADFEQAAINPALAAIAPPLISTRKTNLENFDHFCPELVEAAWIEGSDSSKQGMRTLAEAYHKIHTGELPGETGFPLLLETLIQAMPEIGPFVTCAAMQTHLSPALAKLADFFLAASEANPLTEERAVNGLNILQYSIQLLPMEFPLSERFASVYFNARQMFPENTAIQDIAKKLIFVEALLLEPELFKNTLPLFSKEEQMDLLYAYCRNAYLLSGTMSQQEEDPAVRSDTASRYKNKILTVCEQVPDCDSHVHFIALALFDQLQATSSNSDIFKAYSTRLEELQQAHKWDPVIMLYYTAGAMASKDIFSEGNAPPSIQDSFALGYLNYLNRNSSRPSQPAMENACFGAIDIFSYEKAPERYLPHILEIHRRYARRFMHENYAQKISMVDAVKPLIEDITENAASIRETVNCPPSAKQTHAWLQAMKLFFENIDSHDQGKITANFDQKIKAAKKFSLEHSCLTLINNYLITFAEFNSSTSLNLNPSAGQQIRSSYFINYVIEKISPAGTARQVLHNLFSYKQLLFYHLFEELAIKHDWGITKETIISKKIAKELKTATLNSNPQGDVRGFVINMLNDFRMFARMDKNTQTLAKLGLLT